MKSHSLFTYLVIALSILSTGLESKASEKVLLFLENSSPALDAEASTIWMLAKNEIAKRGEMVIDRIDLQTGPADNVELEQLAKQNGASRVYIISFMPLGKKIIVGIEERELRPSGMVSAYAENATASSVEELDIIIARLVESTFAHGKFENSATIKNVTKNEGRPQVKKFGEFLWGGGVIIGGHMGHESMVHYGANLKFDYEMEHARIDVNIASQANKGYGYVLGDVGAVYLFLSSDISPYIGGTVGFGGIFTKLGDHHGTSGGAVGSLMAGVEFFRLYSTRMVVELKLGLPFFKINDGNGMKHYSPILTGNVCVLF